MMSRKALSRFSIAGGLASVLIVVPMLAVVSAPPSQAWNQLYCRGSSGTIKVYVTSNHEPKTPVGKVGQRWNDGTPVTFVKTTTMSARDLYVNNKDFGPRGWSGMLHDINDFSAPDCVDGRWRRWRIIASVNNYYNSGSRKRRKGVATHEFGHYLGLAHNSNRMIGGCAGGGNWYESIMYPSDGRFNGSCGVFFPTSDDIDGVNHIH